MTPIIMKWVSASKSVVYLNTDGTLLTFQPDEANDITTFETGLRFAKFLILDVEPDFNDPNLEFTPTALRMLTSEVITFADTTVQDRMSIGAAMVIDAGRKYCIAGPSAVKFGVYYKSMCGMMDDPVHRQCELIKALHYYPDIAESIRRDGDIMLATTLDYVNRMVIDVSNALQAADPAC